MPLKGFSTWRRLRRKRARTTPPSSVLTAKYGRTTRPIPRTLSSLETLLLGKRSLGRQKPVPHQKLYRMVEYHTPSCAAGRHSLQIVPSGRRKIKHFSMALYRQEKRSSNFASTRLSLTRLVSRQTQRITPRVGLTLLTLL